MFSLRCPVKILAEIPLPQGHISTTHSGAACVDPLGHADDVAKVVRSMDAAEVTVTQTIRELKNNGTVCWTSFFFWRREFALEVFFLFPMENCCDPCA